MEKAEAIASAVSRVELGNRELARFRKLCTAALALSVTTGELEALESARQELKAAAEAVKLIQSAQLATIQSLRAALLQHGLARSSASFRAKAFSPCEIPGDLEWVRPSEILLYAGNGAGFRVQDLSSRPSWHFENPRVRPLRESTHEN
jgi:hypothetical protein